MALLLFKLAREFLIFVYDEPANQVCANKVLFKQLLQLQAVRYLQVDACRVAGVSEVCAAPICFLETCDSLV